MATSLPVNGNSGSEAFTINAGLARMLKGGVIMDVVNAQQVKNDSLFFCLAHPHTPSVSSSAIAKKSGGG